MKAKQKEILRIKARNILDLSGGYDFTDSKTGESLGGVRRNFRKSILRDSYSVFDPDNNVYAEVKEDSMFNALIRRFVPWPSFLSQQFSLNFEETPE